MWTLSPECHPLWRLYRFKNAKLEAKYQSDCHLFNVWNTQVNYYGTLVYAVLNCVSYMGPPLDAMPVEFWLNFGMAVVSVGFAVPAVAVGRFRRNALRGHFLYCLVRIACFSLVIHFSAKNWYADAKSAWIPDGGHIVVQHAGENVVIDTAFGEFLRTIYGNVAICAGYLDINSIWMFFAMTGLNPYTLAGYVFLLAAILPAALSVGVYTTFGLINFLFILIITTITFLILAIVVERVQRSKALVEDKLLREMRASQTADSVLNHSLKNTMADVAGHIETYCGGQGASNALEDAMACLRRGMRICKERQVFLQLAAGEYRPMQNVVHLREFGEQLVAGRNVQAHFLDLVVYLDSALVSLILDNAISNAFKHGCRDDPQVEFEMVELPSMVMGPRRVQFTVRNAADPEAEPLSPEYVQDLLAGRHQPKKEVPVLSNGIGFSHALMAAKLVGVALNLGQEETVVTFTATMEVREATLSGATLVVREVFGSGPIVQFPRGLRFLVLDDSTVARRLLQFLLTSWCDPSVVHCLGGEEDDVEAFVDLALHGADVLVVDQHLVYERAHLGTDIVKKLRSLGFQGFICLRSGDDGPEDRRLHLQSGANCSLGKDLPGAQFISQLKDAYLDCRSCLTCSDVQSEEEALTHPGPRGRSPCRSSSPPAVSPFTDRFAAAIQTV